MSIDNIFLLALAGCALFAAGLYVERLTRPHTVEVKAKPESRRMSG
ncbi:hypothetical protein ACFSKY_20610 [Azotobacter chroococcum]|jgi:hypothetical protein|uniref:Uncharacterized protein n=1 Tax=Azotobacter chroococcum TaxID=353 RepID=A0A4R1PRL0_9GAMM|nr:hypothetical protein [Azotobacter chroococcum]TCL27450.1 hypothetical protein EV691_12644 [Azotobacter chroococcum]